MIFSRRPAAPTVARRHLALRVEQLDIAEGLPLPAYQSDGAAGLDLIAAVPTNKPMRLKPGARGLVPTGLRLALPRGTEAQVRPRSGLALKHGVTVLNSPGTIDCDYRGEVQVLLVNLGTATFVVNRGERIAQLVIAPVARAELSMATLDGTARGAGGFGSTGQAILSDPNGSAGNGTTTMGVVETSKRKRSDDMARTAAGKKRVGRKAGARKSAARKVTKVAAKKTTRAATKKATRAPARRASAKSARVGARKTARGAASGRRTAAATPRVASRTTAAKRGRTAATKTARKSARKVGAKSVRKAATRRPARGRPTGVRTAARKKSNGLRGRRRS